MTTAFEHLITLGSFILALGIASILVSVATLVHRRGEVKFSAPAVLWMGATFLEQISFWLGSYNYRLLEKASLVTVIFVVIYPTLLFLQAALVAPQPEVSLDLQAHHRRNHRYYAGIAAACSALMVAFFLWGGFIAHVVAVPAAVVLMAGTQGAIALAAVMLRGKQAQLVTASLIALLAVFNFFSASVVLIGV